MPTLAQPYGSPAVATPHFSYPFALTNEGVKVVDQDSVDEVFSCVQAIVNCQLGECPELSGFGIPDITFVHAPPDASGLIASIQSWEPRATESAVLTVLDQAGDAWQIALTTRADVTSAS